MAKSDAVKDIWAAAQAQKVLKESPAALRTYQDCAMASPIEIAIKDPKEKQKDDKQPRVWKETTSKLPFDRVLPTQPGETQIVQRSWTADDGYITIHLRRTLYGAPFVWVQFTGVAFKFDAWRPVPNRVAPVTKGLCVIHTNKDAESAASVRAWAEQGLFTSEIADAISEWFRNPPHVPLSLYNS
jgi:hypothetical protein